jgi:isopentenyldiphosphate isomerase
MEILDIVNEQDEVIGQATRDECHNDPSLLHRTVHFTLFDKATDSILLTRRSLKKTHDAGKLCFLGEHIFKGESYAEALKRGVVEELGVMVSSYQELGHHVFRYDQQSEFVRFFLAKYDGDAITFDKDEIEDVEWVKQESLTSFADQVSDMTNHWIKQIWIKKPQTTN